jgi:SAM-dependent methyltransferase
VPDVYATITEADRAAVKGLVDILELRAADPRQQELPLEDGSFDVVVFHTTLCHVPGPERALTEASRALREGGQVAIFDGDYATTTCASGNLDPLQACAEAFVDYLVHDRWLVRRLPKLARDAGFEVRQFLRP